MESWLQLSFQKLNSLKNRLPGDGDLVRSPPRPGDGLLPVRWFELLVAGLNGAAITVVCSVGIDWTSGDAATFLVLPFLRAS